MRQATIPVALALLFVPTACAQPLIVGVAPDLPGALPGDEGFEIGGPPGFDLTGYAVTDGEGIWTFPAGTHLGPQAGLWIVGNTSTWRHFQGPQPFIALADGIVRGELRLGNERDSLQLLDPVGTPIDAVAWGNSTVPGWRGRLAPPGLGALLVRGQQGSVFSDTDTAADWTRPRIHHIGESLLDAPHFTVHGVTLYSSPDSSHEILRALLAAALHRIHLHVYELRSSSLVDALVAAKNSHPELDLEVLVDADPAGMTAGERHATTWALQRIAGAGGHAWLAGSGRYDDYHQKVLLVDDTVAVQSENWVDSGVPQDPSVGNRGWGIAVHDRPLANWFDAWMAADRAAWDIRAFDPASFDGTYSGWDPPVAPRTGVYGPVVPALELEGNFTVQPLVSPDATGDPGSDPLAQRIRLATRSVDVQQLGLAAAASNGAGWRGADPLLAALQDAAARGASVRVQAAAPFAADDTKNQDALAYLARRGIATSVMARPGIPTLHNKGLVIDDTVVVGSMNANHHSRSANREVDLVVQGPGVAEFFRGLFASDWTRRDAPRDPSVIGKDLHALPTTPVPILLALLGLAIRKRCSD